MKFQTTIWYLLDVVRMVIIKQNKMMRTSWRASLLEESGSILCAFHHMPEVAQLGDNVGLGSGLLHYVPVESRTDWKLGICHLSLLYCILKGGLAERV